MCGDNPFSAGRYTTQLLDFARTGWGRRGEHSHCSPLVLLPRAGLRCWGCVGGWDRDRGRSYRQVVAGRLETVLAGGVADGAPLAIGVHVTVRAPSVSLGVRLLLELHTVALRVSGAELSVVREVPGVGQDGGVLVRGSHGHRRQRQRDKYLKPIMWQYSMLLKLSLSLQLYIYIYTLLVTILVACVRLILKQCTYYVQVARRDTVLKPISYTLL